MLKKINKDFFLNKCEEIYDKYILKDMNSIILLRNACEYVLRIHGGQNEIANEEYQNFVYFLENPNNYSFKISKNEFLERCKTGYEAGYINYKSLFLGKYCIKYALCIYKGEHKKAEGIYQKINKFSNGRTLANFTYLYNIESFGYLLNHPCRKCAFDKNAWHTRYSFCEHNEEYNIVNF